MEINNNILVSVIMPSYNHAAFISEAVDSVINQTYKNWELIIVDNNSTDGTDLILNAFSIKDERIRIIKISNNGIIAKSRNAGLKAAKGSLIAFLDSDDIWFNNKLEKAIELFSITNADCICTNIFRFNESTCSIKPYISRVTGFFNFNDIFPKKNFICQSSVVIKKEIIQAIGYINEDIKVRTIEDYDFWLRILSSKFKFYFDSNVYALYRLHGSNMSKSKVKNAEKHLYYFSKYCKNFNLSVFARFSIQAKLIVKYFLSFVKYK
jgi:glycosyltransferase involved in cell wall biosynthesis